MKKKPDLEDDDDDRHLEILKAVAQAWQSHAGSSKPATASEFDAHRRNCRANPSRFKLEAIRKRLCSGVGGGGGLRWDFGLSLWDSYEIVAVSKKLEAGLVIDGVDGGRIQRKKRESSNSLRNLFNRASSRRFN